ncbi:hypothetical protein HDU96_010011 [Phlyctochytrium bullatum]|nr:hypothetical protein HDU96_010011 [Phlyctochytrium bullatum]
MKSTIATAITLLAATTAVLAQAPQINQCDKDKLPDGWVAGRVTAELRQISFAQQNNPTAAVTCSGTIVIVDGCSNALQSAWYGGVVGLQNGQVVENDMAVRFANEDVIPQNGGESRPYTLATTAGAAYSFFSINQIRVFDLTNRQVFCVADLPYQNPRATLSLAAGGAASTAAGSAAAATTSRAVTSATASATTARTTAAASSIPATVAAATTTSRSGAESSAVGTGLAWLVALVAAFAAL